MRDAILSILERDSRVTPQEIGQELSLDTDAVILEIQRMEQEKVICGYNAIVNWDKVKRRLVTALIEVRVTPQRGNGFDKIAERIYHFDEVKAVYLMSGGFDLTVVVEGKDIKEVAFFVSDKLSPIDAVISTATHFVLKNYKDHWVIMGKGRQMDERMIVSP